MVLVFTKRKIKFAIFSRLIEVVHSQTAEKKCVFAIFLQVFILYLINIVKLTINSKSNVNHHDFKNFSRMKIKIRTFLSSN